MNTFAERRRRAGLSIESAAELLNLSAESIAEYEQGLRRPKPREIQVLNGLALGVRRKKGTSETFECEVIRAERRPDGHTSSAQGSNGMSELKPLENPSISLRFYTAGKAEPETVTSASSPLSFYEFFCGGGMVRAGLGPNWECLFANDFDLKKCATYKRNWGANNLVAKDVADLETTELPGSAGLAWASFPCQDLSLAGMGAGLRGDRSGTFWPFWRLITKLKAEGRAPRIIALENVCGTLTSHGGKDFTAIADALSGADYRFGAMVIDAVDFLPQSRPRLFILAVARDILISSKMLSDDATLLWHPRALQIAQMRLTGKSKENWLWWKLPAPPLRNTRFADFIEENPKSVAWHTTTETSRLLSMMNKLNLEKVRAAQKTGQLMVGGIYKRTRFDDDDEKVQRAEVRFDNIAGCLRTSTGGSSRQSIIVVKGDDVRSRLLSSREAARLMGLPDDYQLPESYNEAYHLIGDGVAVPVVRYVAEHLLEPVLVENYGHHSSSPASEHRSQPSRPN